MDNFDNDFGLDTQDDGFTDDFGDDFGDGSGDSFGDDFSDDFFDDDDFGSDTEPSSDAGTPVSGSKFNRFRNNPAPINLSDQSGMPEQPDSQMVPEAIIVSEEHSFAQQPAEAVPAYQDEAPAPQEEPVYQEVPVYQEETPAPQEEPVYQEVPVYQETAVPQEEPPIQKDPAELLIEYTDCHYKLIASGTDINDLNRKFLYALHYGTEWGYSTVMIPVSQKLADKLCLDENGTPVSTEQLRHTRKQALSQAIDLPGNIIDEKYRQKTAVMASKGIDINEFEHADIPGAAINCFSSFVKNGLTTRDLLLVQVPVSKPWQVFAWLPVGGAEGMPSNEELMTASKEWYEICGAVPAVLDYATVEYFVPNGRPSYDDALRIARGHFALCHERVLRLTRSHTLSELVNTLTKSCVWYLGWK